MANTKTRKSAIPIYGAAATWAVYALAFNLYRPTDFACAALLSASVFLLLQSVCPEEAVETPAEAPEPEEKYLQGILILTKLFRTDI